MLFLISILLVSVIFIRFVRRRSKSIGFFHPYCDAGGGGERVLWEAVTALSREYPTYEIIVYSGDGVDGSLILQRAKSRFNIDVPQVQIVPLKWRWLVEAQTWPVFTLAGQSLGSIILALEAVVKVNPEVMIDSMGYSFAYPLFVLVGCRVGCYIHYPTISTDMLKKVENRNESFNNRSFIAKNTFLSKGKLLYYKIFSFIYGVCGRCATSVMTNSSWTKGHLDLLWRLDTVKIFPPCDVSRFQQLDLAKKRIPGRIISLAQFRPEKNHKLQIEALAILLKKVDRTDIRLIMAGGVRNEGDAARADELEKVAKNLGLDKIVSIERNVSFPRILELFETADCGIHTMQDEHFGITCVDFQASGVVPVGHNSAGPKMDILVPCENEPTGFLAETAEEFAESLKTALQLNRVDRANMQRNMRKSCYRFSAEKFRADFLGATKPLFDY